MQNDGKGVPKSTATPHKQRLPLPIWDVRYKSGSLTLKEVGWLKGAFVPAESASKTAPGAISVDQLRKTTEQSVPFLTIAPEEIQAA